MAATEVEAGEGGGPVVRLTALDEEEEVIFLIIILFTIIITLLITLIIIEIIQVPFKPCGCRHPCGCEKPCTFMELKVSFISTVLILFTSSYPVEISIPDPIHPTILHLSDMAFQIICSRLFLVLFCLLSSSDAMFCKIFLKSSYSLLLPTLSLVIARNKNF